MGDVMEGNASLYRRSNLPSRIVPDRPKKQANQILWGAITSHDKTNDHFKDNISLGQ